MVDREKRKRLRLIRVIIADIITVASVVVIMIILIGMVAGWRFGEDMTLEQNGLVQINSVPSGATIAIDGETTMGGTDTSKMLPGGEHEIVLTKDGYESWSKTVTVHPGWLLNVTYPRLFKVVREKKTIKTTENLEFFKVAPNRKSIIYAKDKTPKWYYMTDLDSDEPKVTELDLSKFVPEIQKEDSEEVEKKLEVANVQWNKNCDRLIVKTNDDAWLMVNLKKPAESMNISESLSSFKDYDRLMREITDPKIDEIKMLNDSGLELYVKINNSLYKVNLENKNISVTSAISISEYALHESEIIFVTLPDENGVRYIRLYKDGDDSTLDFYVSENADEVIHVGLSEYYNKRYVIYTLNQKIYVYRADNYPSNGKNEMELMVESETRVMPDSLEISRNGEFFIMRKEEDVVVYDAEVEKYVEYAYINKRSQWLDDYILYGVEDGTLWAWDFDGLNQRKLVLDNVVEGYDVAISANNKYMYYVVFTEDQYELRREKL